MIPARGWRAHAAAAATLRAWALRVLGPGPGAVSPGEWAEVAAVGGRGWLAFLGAERCALPLYAALGPGSPLPAPAARLLAARAQVESQRALSARAQLRLLGGLAARHGWTLAVLKGGAGLLEGLPEVDLGDVDVLATPGQAAALDAALVGGSYRKVFADGTVHLGAHLADGSVQVEVHFAMRAAEAGDGVLDRAVPTAREPRLRRLADADHLWHLLSHSAATHLPRRGCLRDLLLVGWTLRASAPAAVAEVRARAAAHPLAGALAGVLAMAEALADGRAPADPFAELARVRYRLVASGWMASLPEPVFRRAADAAAALAQGPGEYRALWRAAARMPRRELSSIPALRFVERRSRALGHVALFAGRASLLAAAVPFALLAALPGRRAARPPAASG
ncbi:MAG: hypothetical protein JWM27_2295 [Gemmatimonadetes bacterium]|nr:hypothetical protein [Gemmatimonadota bacterium]